MSIDVRERMTPLDNQHLNADDPRDGDAGAGEAPPWHGRAAFYLEVEFRAEAGGVIAWRTHAHHEESDTSIVWPGQPGASLLGWLHERLAQEGQASPDQSAEAEAGAPAAPPSTGDMGAAQADDLRKIREIGPAIERRLHDAGIFSYAQLVACTPARLAEITGRSAEQVARFGWIAQAQQLARAAPPVGPTEAERRAEAERPVAGASHGTPVLFAEILLDEHDNVQDQRLLRGDQNQLGPDAWPPRRFARFFLDLPSGAAGEEASGEGPGELILHIDEVSIEPLGGQPRARGEPNRLRAEALLHIDGIGAAEATERRAAYIAYVLAFDLSSAKTNVLQAATGRFQPGMSEYVLAIEAALPEIGHYQLLLAATVPACSAIGAAEGPALHVTR
jgi:predicted flap endonuclease-1-like 5' DNA nuclease